MEITALWDLVWNTVIFNPLLNTLVLLTTILGNNYGLAIIVFTILIRVITMPFTTKQLSSSRAMAALQPQIKALQKKYAQDREKLSQETMKLYKEAGVSPLGGCLPALIPWPIMIALYQSILQMMPSHPEQLMELSKHLYPFQAIWQVVPVQNMFLGLDLSKNAMATGEWPYYILPILVVVSSWLQQKMLTSPSADSQQAQMNQTMQVTMPLFIGFISLQFATGLSLYWIVYNVVTMVVSYVLMRDSLPPLSSYVPASLAAYLPFGKTEAPAPKKKAAVPAPVDEDDQKPATPARKPASRRRKKRR
ncbi:MAG: YidC/Oxa1 family membrane protein insertase [Chloroflexi bacterium]|nr:YidC/Oxa1 family membrane protein insertase [Chloroflexota bacterium]MBU1752055.1 YidC/Oxa1 family membrane protein insertase [Chloroflexota bacterium]